VRAPSTDELAALADDLGITFSDGELEDYATIVADTLELIEGVEEMPTPQLAPREYEYTDRGPGYQPDDEEDPHNAWITKCHIEGAETGPLADKTVGLKDNISLAGIELTNGSDVMQGYVPAVDATAVSRLLDAGATIKGKNNMWAFSLGESDYGPPENPAAPEYSIGGSSSGTAAAVAAGEVDIGMGGDQGGSIRDPSLDHTGPMTRTVEDAALTMDAVAGRDGLDPRQPHDLEVQDYTGALEEDISDTTVGVLEEGFGFEESHPEVDAVVRDAIEDLEAAGAEVVEVSIPEHLDGSTISTPILQYGTTQVMKQNGAASGFDGWYDTGAMAYLGRALDGHSSDLPPNLKSTLLASEYIQQQYGGAVYGKAQNLTIEMRERYDEALEDVDALVMPTTPIRPPEHGELMGMERLLGDGPVDAMGKNTSIFDVTHHPALTVPCGEADDTPVGMMLVGERFDDATLLKLGYAYEQYAQ